MRSARDNDVVPLHPPFEMSLRGFDRRQVLEYVESVEAQLKLISSDRDDALEQAGELRKLLDHVRQEAEEMRTRLDRVENAPTSTGGMAERLHHMMLLAEDETAELRRRTEQETTATRRQAEATAREIRETAEAEAAEVRAECAQRVAEIEQRQERLDAEHQERLRAFADEQRCRREEIAEQEREILAKARADADALLAETTQRCERLESESEARRLDADRESQARRDAAERDAEESLARRREETRREIADREAQSATRLELMMQLVAQESRRRIDAADRRSAQLRALQTDLGEQIRSAQHALGDAAGQVELAGGGAETVPLRAALGDALEEPGRHRAGPALEGSNPSSNGNPA